MAYNGQREPARIRGLRFNVFRQHHLTVNMKRVLTDIEPHAPRREAYPHAESKAGYSVVAADWRWRKMSRRGI